MKIGQIYFCISIVVGWILCIQPAAADDTVRYHNDSEKIAILELFASQGCSSCPSAEAWINKLADHPGLWTEMFPMVFHVDYWDYLGWKDPFATRGFTDRQYAYKRAGQVDSVYTPGFVLNGQEWRGWFREEEAPELAYANGELSAELVSSRLTVTYSQRNEDLILNVAVLGFGFKTEVPRGENSGRTLVSHFVVLSHKQYSSTRGRWMLDVSQEVNPAAKRYGLVIWVTKSDNDRPLQAVGGWLPDIHVGGTAPDFLNY